MPEAQQDKDLEDKREVVEKNWRHWYLWQCIAPLAVLFMMWPIGGIIVEAEHSFHKAFADGNLLIFSALLLIGVSLEFRKTKSTNRGNRNLRSILDSKAEISLFAAVLLILWFGAVKVDMMQGDYFSKNPLPPKMLLYSLVSLVSAAGSVGFAANAFWEMTRKLLEGME